MPGLERDLLLQLLPKDANDARGVVVEVGGTTLCLGGSCLPGRSCAAPVQHPLPDRTQRATLPALLVAHSSVLPPTAHLQVRAGTGGDEACLFAMELFRMYERFASVQGWKFEVGLSDGWLGFGGRRGRWLRVGRQLASDYVPLHPTMYALYGSTELTTLTRLHVSTPRHPLVSAPCLPLTPPSSLLLPPQLQPQMVELAESELGGCKLASAAISGGSGGVYGHLKFESGIHRVQRVPVTESGAPNSPWSCVLVFFTFIGLPGTPSGVCSQEGIGKWREGRCMVQGCPCLFRPPTIGVGADCT